VDSQQAKEILKAYRPGVDDADPQVAEALGVARRDPELSRWLERQMAVDAVIRGKLRDVAIPVGLKTRILANAKVESPALAWWRQPGWLTAAAAVLVVVAVAMFMPRLRPANTFASYRVDMAKFVSVEYKLDVKSDKFEDLRQAAVKSGSPSIPALPPALAKLRLEGGCLLNWHGHKVTLVCMEAKDHDVWLFVADSKTLPDTPPATPVFAKDGKITTASWMAGPLTYILATEGDEAELRSYL